MADFGFSFDAVTGLASVLASRLVLQAEFQQFAHSAEGLADSGGADTSDSADGDGGLAEVEVVVYVLSLPSGSGLALALPACDDRFVFGAS